MKVTVPKHTTYMFKSEESGWYMYLYEEDFNKAIEGNNQVSAVNTTDTDKTYYKRIFRNDNNRCKSG